MLDAMSRSEWVEISPTLVDPRALMAVRDMVDRVAPELGLGQVDVRYVARADMVPANERATPTVFTSSGPDLHGSAIYTGAGGPGWPPRPTIYLVAGAFKPNDVLHEVRHLWQSHTGFDGDQAAREADAHAWAGQRIKTLPGPWRPPRS